MIMTWQAMHWMCITLNPRGAKQILKAQANPVCVTIPVSRAHISTPCQHLSAPRGMCAPAI